LNVGALIWPLLKKADSRIQRSADGAVYYNPLPNPMPAIRKVLLIDDDPDDFSIFEDAVRSLERDIEVQYIAAWKDLPAPGNCDIPDLLFLDINMPDKNGFEWLKAIREAGYSLPVVMYSTASNPDFVQRAYREGAHIYLQKPDNFRILQHSLKYIFHLDWTMPDKVKEYFFRNGRYEVFSLSEVN
jgi:DNA-binding NtrC family response regulator